MFSMQDNVFQADSVYMLFTPHPNFDGDPAQSTITLHVNVVLGPLEFCLVRQTFPHNIGCGT